MAHLTSPLDQSSKLPALHNYEAEQALLAGLMANNLSWPKVATIVRPEHFADALHGRLFALIGKLIGRGEVANVLSLKPHFEADPWSQANQAAATKYLIRIASSVVTILNLPDYAHAIRDLWLRRAIVEEAQAIAEKAASDLDTPADEVIATSTNFLMHLSRQGRITAVTRRQVKQQLVDALGKPSQVTSTGIGIIDHAMAGGMYAGKLYGISGRKKAGKSALKGTISYNLERSACRHLVVMLEMSPLELAMRDAARFGDINAMEFLRRTSGGHIGRHAIDVAEDYAAAATGDATIFEHCPGATLDEVRAICSRAIVQHRVKGIILDYMQLVTGQAKGTTEEKHLRDVAQWMADFCRRHNIWGLIGTQENQEGNTRGGEGIRLACDLLFGLRHEPGSPTAWLEMMETRYTPWQNVGSEEQPGLDFHHNGTYFTEAGPTAQADMGGDFG